MLARNLDHGVTSERVLRRRSVRTLWRLGGIIACVCVLVGCADFSSTARLTPTLSPLPTLQGVMEEFAIPAPRSDPYGIIIGPDRNLWFTESKPSIPAHVPPTVDVKPPSLPTSWSIPASNSGLPRIGQSAPAFRHGDEWPSSLAVLEHLCYVGCVRTGDEPVFGGLRLSAPCTTECSRRSAR